jgi:hypothetical protein
MLANSIGTVRPKTVTNSSSFKNGTEIRLGGDDDDDVWKYVILHAGNNK